MAYILKENRFFPILILWETNTYISNFRVCREVDGKKEEATTSLEEGFNSWQHYVMTYRYVAGDPGNHITIYHDGVEEAGVQKVVQDWNITKISGCGVLDLGRYYIDNDDTMQGNMILDELIIWEVQISAEDVASLFDAY